MARLYNGKTWEEMNAIYTKQYKDTTPEEREYLAGLTKDDYDAYVMEKNYATAQPNTYYLQGGTMQPYTGWNGGSVTGADMMAAVDDSLKYGYDIQLDPRNNAGAREAINNTLLDASERANLDAINGSGDYETNRQDYLNQIGWTDYQSVFESLQNTGTLGLKDMDGVPIEQAYELGNPNFVWTGGEPEYVANVNLATGEKNTPSAQQTPQSNVIDMTTQPIAGVPNVEAPLLPYEPDYSGLQNLAGQKAQAGQGSGYQSEYLQQLQQMMPSMPEGYQSQYTQALQKTPTMPESYKSQYTQALQQTPTMPESYQSQYTQALQKTPTMPEAYQSQYTQQLQQMPTLQTPEQSSYYEQMMQALNVPQSSAPDLSGLQNLLQLPQSGPEVTPYEGDLNALLRTPEQQAAYKEQLQALQQQYAMPEVQAFSYDPATDPIYQAYLQQFTRDANQGMRDTLGQISARTGGLASSYAGQAAQQTYNNYMKQAADILPTMNEAAYNRWLNEQQLALNANATAYNRALDALDRQTAAEQTDWERQAYVDEQAYNRYQNELAQQLAAQQAAWDRQAYVEGESYNRQQNAYNQQLTANQLAWDRLAQLDATEYARQLDAINLQNAYEQEAYNRALNLEQLAYQQYLNNANMQQQIEQEAYDRALTQEQLAYQQYLNNVDLQRATEQEAYDRALTQEQLAYQQYLNNANMQQQIEQEAYDRALTQEQLAYQKYLNNVDLQRATEQEAYDRKAYLEALGYDRYLDEVNRQIAAEQTDWERQAYADEQAYARQQDQYQNQLAAEQQAYERQIYQQQLAADQQAQNANLLLGLMESYGYTPTAQELAAAGLSQGMANAVGDAYQNQLAMQWASINNKASGGGTGDVPQATDYLNVLQSAGVKDPGTAMFMLVNAGMKVSDAETLASYYMDILDGQGQTGGNNAGGAGGNLPSAVVNEAILRVNDYLYSGNANQAEQAMNYVERIWEDLSEAEKQNIVGMFAAAGYNLQG